MLGSIGGGYGIGSEDACQMENISLRLDITLIWPS